MHSGTGSGSAKAKSYGSCGSCDDGLGSVVVLPAKNNDRPKLIIARFYSRNMRAMIFRLKKEFAPYKPATTDTSSRHYKAGRRTFKYPIYEDLTKDTYNLLQALLKDERTGPVWTVSGNAGETTIKKVSSIYDSVEKILG
jgi:hypothetical protein